MGVAIFALFSALGQAPVTAQGGDARRAAVDAALRSCVRQAAAVALGRPPAVAEEPLLTDEALADARALVDNFRVLDEGEGGGLRFASVEADVSLARVARRLAPLAEPVRTSWTREVGAPADVRGAGRQAISARMYGDVHLGDLLVGMVDETAWGFGATAEEALADAQRGAAERADAAAQRLVAAAIPGRPALIGLTIRGGGRAALALALCAALSGRVPGIIGARVLRAGSGRAEIAVETTLPAETLARAIESVDVAGRSLLAEVAPGGDVDARWMER